MQVGWCEEGVRRQFSYVQVCHGGGERRTDWVSTVTSVQSRTVQSGPEQKRTVQLRQNRTVQLVQSRAVQLAQSRTVQLGQNSTAQLVKSRTV